MFPEGKAAEVSPNGLRDSVVSLWSEGRELLSVPGSLASPSPKEASRDKPSSAIVAMCSDTGCGVTLGHVSFLASTMTLGSALKSDAKEEEYPPTRSRPHSKYTKFMGHLNKVYSCRMACTDVCTCDALLL